MTMISHEGLYKSRSFRLDANEQRQRRIEEGQSLRKEKREDELTRQRSFCSAPEAVDEMMEMLTDDVDMLEVTKNEQNSPVKKEWIKLLFSDIVYDQLGATEKFARLVNRKPEIRSELIEMGLLPRFFELLQNHQNLRLQERAGMVLTDLTNQKVISALPSNVVQILTNIFESNVDREVINYAIIILGNIAEESASLRDQILNSSAWPKLLQILESSTEHRLLSSGVFTLCNLCLQPSSNFDRISMCLPLLVQFIHHEDYEIISFVCRALSFLCEFSIQTVIDTGSCPRLVELLSCRSSNKVMAAAANTIGNILIGSETQTQLLIDLNALPALYQLLHSKKNEIVVQSCWAISNIGAGSGRQIQSVLDGGFLQILMKLLYHSELDVQTEAVWAFRNCISRSRTSRNQIDFMVSMGVVQALCGVLTSNSIEILHTVLKALKVILDFGGEESFEAIRKCGALTTIVSLEAHQSSVVSKYASKVLSRFKN